MLKRANEMQYIQRTAFIVLLATLHYLVADSKPLPVTNGHVPQATTTSQPNSAATTEHSQVHSFNNSADNYTAGDNYNVDVTRPKMSKADKSHLDNPDYFEGDLKVPQEIIDMYYGVHNNTQDGKRTTRDVTRNKYFLWPSGIVYFNFHTSIDASTQNIIQGAIDEIERETCIQFYTRTVQSDFITFTGEGDACASYGIGRVGVEQRITLPVGCRTHGMVLHEIGHALGLWHEQSRPDRDQYVEIVHANIDDSNGPQFAKRTEYDIDYHGEGYDYGSIMHYERDAFSSNGQDTIRVSNQAEYNSQGRPTLGQRLSLSDSDVQQLNRMYNCPGSGVPGILKVYVKYGHNLPDRDEMMAGDSDPYTVVFAVDDRRERSLRYTQYILDNQNPTWNTWLDFGGRISWQYFEMIVFDADIGYDEQLTYIQAFSISPGYHSDLRHCSDPSCSAYVVFDYNLIPDGDECTPNPCVHGSCTDLISDYQCSCDPGYSGKNCDHIIGTTN